MAVIETDYLVVGAGAAGMAFTDSLIAESDADVVMVDRRHRPGGHWNDAYPFVRLHQPSAFYGVNSRVLGTDSIDEVGPNAGFYERATAAEICDYFHRVLEEHLLPSGQVRFFGMCDYIDDDSNEHRFVSRLTGETTTVRVRRKVVDATYLETAVPSTHTPSFDVDPGRAVHPGQRSRRADRARQRLHGHRRRQDRDGRVHAGCSTTASPPTRSAGSGRATRGCSTARTAAARRVCRADRRRGAATSRPRREAESVDDLFRRLEASGQLVRIDPAVEPTMYRCATVSQAELESLRSIENVVRLGRVRAHRHRPRSCWRTGTIPTDPGQVHVDCTAGGLRVRPARPIFEPDRITLQQVRTCQPTFNAALIGFVEACPTTTTRRRTGSARRTRIRPPRPTGSRDRFSNSARKRRWFAAPDVAAWLDGVTTQRRRAESPDACPSPRCTLRSRG